MPAQSSRNSHGAAEPSWIGNSARSSSTSTLSTALPASVAIRCSIVPTRHDAISAFGDRGGESGVGDAIEARRDVPAEIGAPEHDPVIRPAPDAW